MVDTSMPSDEWILVDVSAQKMTYYRQNKIHRMFDVSTAKNGVGEIMHSECTPRGWHAIHTIIGLNNAVNSVFVAREWTGEIYSESLAAAFPERDWILTRILRLEGLELGRNKGGVVDSFERYIYIHGTPDSVELGKPGSRGCVRMRNTDIVELAKLVACGARVYIE